MGKYFGTDGFRGKAGEGLTADHAYQIGRFLGWYFGRTHRAQIVVGKDTRRSSYMLEYAISAGMAASGADVHLLHVTTTPSVSYVTRTDGFDCGVMISASHNPFYDNGIKLINGEGEKMEESVISLVEDYLDGVLELDGQPWKELPMATEARIGSIVDDTAGRNRYMGYLISLAIYSFKGKRVALDCANGSAWHIAPRVFEALGAQVFPINTNPDGTNINLNAGSTHIEGLQRYVVENKMDVGFAYDGDADRCLAVDENGKLVDGDQIMYLYACYMKERGKLLTNKVVTTVMSNFGLYKALDAVGIGYEKTAVGDKYVYENMVQNGHRIGGEQSGHTIFTALETTGDGEVTALQFLQVLAGSGKKASELVSGCATYPQVLINVEVPHSGGVKEKIMASEALAQAVAAEEAALGGEGRVLVRPSGTEALIRVMVEAKTTEQAQAVAEKLADFIKTQKV